MVDFTVNDAEEAAYDSAERRGYEQLLRKLLQLPSRCVHAWVRKDGCAACFVGSSLPPSQPAWDSAEGVQPLFVCTSQTEPAVALWPLADPPSSSCTTTDGGTLRTAARTSRRACFTTPPPRRSCWCLRRCGGIASVRGCMATSLLHASVVCPLLRSLLMCLMPSFLCVQYYDFPAISVRSAVHPLMRARVNNFRVRCRRPSCQVWQPHHQLPDQSVIHPCCSLVRRFLSQLP